MKVGDFIARLSTCKNCDSKLNADEKFIHNSKTYCESCYNKIKRESEEYKQLVDFICLSKLNNLKRNVHIHMVL